MAGTASAGDVPLATETRTIEVDLRVGFANIVPLANGVDLRIETFKYRGRIGIRVFDAATGRPIQTVRVRSSQSRPG